MSVVHKKFILRKLRIAALLGVVFLCNGLLAVEPASKPASKAGNSDLESIVAERKAKDAKNIAAIQKQLMEAIKQDPDTSVATPMTKLCMPIANHPNGRVRARLNAAYALLPQNENECIRANNITLELFDPTGVLESIFTAEDCVFDRWTKVGYCEGPVRLLYRKTKQSESDISQVEILEITGSNMVIDVENNNTTVTIPVSPVIKFDSFMDGLEKVFTR